MLWPLLLGPSCQDLTTWNRIGGHHYSVSINLESSQLTLTTARKALEIVNAHGISPRQINFEITEREPLLDSREARQAFTALSKAGFGLIVDDLPYEHSTMTLTNFGGYLAGVKLAGKFVARLDDEPNHRLMAQAFIAFCRSNRMTVTAEGIEQAVHFKRAEELGCTHVQGYFFQGKLSTQEISELFEQPTHRLSD